MLVEVLVMLKKDVLDAQGRQVKNALQTLEFNEVNACRVGKIILLDMAEDDWEKARQRAEEMAEKLLANTVIEDFVVRRHEK